MYKNCFVLVLLIFLLSSFIPPLAFGQLPSVLQEGITQYKNENYEEAIEILTKARQQDKTSSAAAFFLGLSYKQANEYQRALDNMRDAVSLTPPIKEAVIEMMDILNQLDQLDEAMKWVTVAETWRNRSSGRVRISSTAMINRSGSRRPRYPPRCHRPPDRLPPPARPRAATLRPVGNGVRTI